MAIHGAQNLTQNARKPAEPGPEGGSVYFVDDFGKSKRSPQNGIKRADDSSVYFADDFGRAKKLMAELIGLGVVLRADDGKLAYDAPAGAITDDLLARMRTDRDGLLAILAGLADDPVAAHGDRFETTIVCPFCRGRDLVDDAGGLRCGRCRALAWIDTAGGGLVRADYAEAEFIDFDDVPSCSSCGRWCDFMTLADSWKCSRCDPEADSRRRRTLRVLSAVERARKRSVVRDP